MQKIYITELSKLDGDPTQELSWIGSIVAPHSMVSMVHILPSGEAAPHMQSVPGVILLESAEKKSKHQISYLLNHLCKNYQSLNKQITK